MMLAALWLLSPPLPPPEEDRWAAARAVWAKLPASAGEMDDAISMALSSLTDSTLVDGGVRLEGSAWEKHEALKARLLARVPADRRAIDREAVDCASKDMAYSLTARELRQVAAFVGTEAGAKFWTYGGDRRETLSRCYQQTLRFLVHADEDLLFVGVKPPERPYPPQPMSD